MGAPARRRRRHPSGARIDHAAAVRAASTYWQLYLGRRVFELVDDSERADVLVRFVDPEGWPPHVLGDAPDMSSELAVETLNRPEHVRVRRGLSPRATRLVVAHELGHVLGLQEGEEPERVMALAKHHALGRADA